MIENIEVCDAYHIPIIEMRESLGSFVKNKHTGTFGSFGTFSFNGNKIITTGGGGMITESEMLARKAKHLTTLQRCHIVLSFSMMLLGLIIECLI